MHQTWVCTTKSAVLERPIVGAAAFTLVPHWSLFGRYLVANNHEWSLFGCYVVANSSNQLPMISIQTTVRSGAIFEIGF
jgi:hypothetical protein